MNHIQILQNLNAKDYNPYAYLHDALVFIPKALVTVRVKKILIKKQENLSNLKKEVEYLKD